MDVLSLFFDPEWAVSAMLSKPTAFGALVAVAFAIGLKVGLWWPDHRKMSECRHTWKGTGPRDHKIVAMVWDVTSSGRTFSVSGRSVIDANFDRLVELSVLAGGEERETAHGLARTYALTPVWGMYAQRHKRRMRKLVAETRESSL